MRYLSRRAQPDHHGYAGYKGTPEFRAAIAGYYQRRFGVTVDPESQVIPLLGSKEGIVNLSLAYLDRGDLALVPDIGYPAYSMGAYLAGADGSLASYARSRLAICPISTQSPPML